MKTLSPQENQVVVHALMAYCEELDNLLFFQKGSLTEEQIREIEHAAKTASSLASRFSTKIEAGKTKATAMEVA